MSNKSDQYLKPYAYRDLLFIRWRFSEVRPSILRVFINDLEVPKPIFGIMLKDNTECLLIAFVTNLSTFKKATIKICNESGEKIITSTGQVLKPFTGDDFKSLPLRDRLRIWEGLLHKVQKTFPAIPGEVVRQIVSSTATKDAFCLQLTQGILYFRTSWPNTQHSRIIDTQISLTFMDGNEKFESIKSLIDDKWIHCVLSIPNTSKNNEILITLNDGNKKTVVLKLFNVPKPTLDELQNNNIYLKQYGGNKALVSTYVQQRLHNCKLESLPVYKPENDASNPIYTAIDWALNISGFGLLISGWIIDINHRIQSIHFYQMKEKCIDLLINSIEVSRPDIYLNYHKRGFYLKSCALGFLRLYTEPWNKPNNINIDFTMKLVSGLEYRLPSVKIKPLDPKDLLSTDVCFAILEMQKTQKNHIQQSKLFIIQQSLSNWFKNSDPFLQLNSTQLINDLLYLTIETAVFIPNAGLFLSGWKIDPGSNIQSIKVIDDLFNSVEISDKLIITPRPDVYNHFSEKGHSFNNNQLGFHCLVPLSSNKIMASISYFKIKCISGEVYRLPIKTEEAKLNDSLSYIKKLLLTFNKRHTNLRTLLDECIGPAVKTLWEYRTLPDLKLTETSFGKLPNKPIVSIIVPLYGRIDLLQHQLCLIADDSDFQENELIYVLDDPTLYTSLIDMCQDIAPLFNVPFKLVFGGYNMGYGGANNLGAQLAIGDYLVFLNSDIMPKECGWLEQLTSIYKILPKAGVIGTKLLYADGSIQHAGMKFENSNIIDGLWLNDHPLKGHPNKYNSDAQHIQKISITGACIMLKKTIFHEIGGFSEDYIIGDFEDSDLCLKSHNSGYHNWYIPSVELYHLERQSQSTPANCQWRYHLTLYNCWLHTQKWGALIHEIKTKGDKK